MKRKSLTVLLLIAVIITSVSGLCSCGMFPDKSGNSGYKYLSDKETETMVKNADKNDVIIVDSRGKEAWAHGHIEGSIPMEMEDFDKNPPKQLPDKSQKILIY